MITIKLILTVVFLFIAVLYTLSNGIKLLYKNTIPAANMILWTADIVGFIVMTTMV